MANTNNGDRQHIGNFKRATGLLLIEVRDSNPNGDPDQGGEPRQRPNRLGEISPVSFKRKPRDLIEHKEGPVWKELKELLDLDESRFQILESRDTERGDATIKLVGDGIAFLNEYWDARIFGTTFLESGKDDKASSYMKKLKDDEKKQVKRNSIKTGVVQFGLGISVAPIDIDRFTLTKKAGAEEGKDRGMAPHAYRIVRHGLYCMPFFVNPSMADKTRCTGEDIELLLKLIPHAYPHTRSNSRPNVDIVHAWYVEHSDKLGSCSDFAILDALKPKKLGDPNKPSQGQKLEEEYDIPKVLSETLKAKKDRHGNPALRLRDLMTEI